MKGITMAKFKIKYVKFVYTPKHRPGTDWATAPKPVIGFGNRHTDEWNQYMFNSNNISIIFSEYLKDDPRKYDKKAKFTESEASILLLKYIEDRLARARKEKRRLDKMTTGMAGLPGKNICGIEYAKTVNKRELTYNTEAAKIWRKKVREIKKSPEYLWEQLSK